VVPGSEALGEIARRFGAEVLHADGSLDRGALARRVFRDPAARAELEAITHPPIRALARERFDALETEGHPLACYVVPLLYEGGLETKYSPVVVVTASQAQQLERAAGRDQVATERIAERLRSQMPLAEKARRADYVIDNSYSKQAAFAEADRVLAAICARFGVDSARYGAA
jgi:dephospho-CoA kinase